jgi:hypothetical protein
MTDKGRAVAIPRQSDWIEQSIGAANRTAIPAAPPPVVMAEQAANASVGVMAGKTISAVAIQVDFALARQ